MKILRCEYTEREDQCRGKEGQLMPAPLPLATLASLMCRVLYVTGWEEVVPLRGLSLSFLLKPLQCLPRRPLPTERLC